jgi:pullulanase/glycogen debranching enzyme
VRERVMRSLMATLAFSLGVPMLNQGDEFARTQQGNNNPWNQDSALTWLSWLPSPPAGRMLAFTRHLLEVRRRYTVFRRPEFLPGHESSGAIAHWLGSSGAIMTEADWQDRSHQLLGVLLHTDVQGTGEAGRAAGGARLMLVLNGGSSAGQQHLPAGRWRVVLDTAHPGAERTVTGAMEMPGHSLVLLEARVTSRSRAP